MYPLMLTVEHERVGTPDALDWPYADYGVIKLNGREIKRIKLDHYHQADERETLEMAVGDWLIGRFATQIDVDTTPGAMLPG